MGKVRKYRIAWDCRKLDNQKTGIGIYISNILRQFSSSANNYQFLLYTDKKSTAWQFPKNMVLITTPPGANRKSLWQKPFSPFWLNFILPQYLKRDRIDLFHSPNHLLPLFYQGKTIVTVHDLIPFIFPQVYGFWYPRYFRLLLPITLRRADAIVTPSQTTKNDLLSLFPIKEAKIKVVYNGIDEMFKVIEEQELLEKMRKKLSLPKRFILFVGTVEYRKNLLPLVRAFQKLVRIKGIGHKLVIVGKLGIGSDEILRVVSELGVKEEVMFLNYLPAEDLPFVYNLADLFVYPSIYEGFGLPVIEAMACGVPVITSDCSALKEIAQGASLLIDPKDADDLGKKILLLLENEDLRKELKVKGLSRANAFSWKRTAERLLSLYDDLLAKTE